MDVKISRFLPFLVLCWIHPRRYFYISYWRFRPKSFSPVWTRAPGFVRSHSLSDGDKCASFAFVLLRPWTLCYLLCACEGTGSSCQALTALMSPSGPSSHTDASWRSFKGAFMDPDSPRWKVECSSACQSDRESVIRNTLPPSVRLCRRVNVMYLTEFWLNLSPQWIYFSLKSWVLFNYDLEWRISHWTKDITLSCHLGRSSPTLVNSFISYERRHLKTTSWHILKSHVSIFLWRLRSSHLEASSCMC